MSKKICCILVLVVVVLSGCGKSVNSSVSSTEPPIETVKTLFENAADVIKSYLISGASNALDNDFNGKAFKGVDGEIQFGKLLKTIDGRQCFETVLTYQQVFDKYSEIFTGTALDTFLSAYFIDSNGVLYVNDIGGMSGFDIKNIKVAFINQSGGVYSYQAAYDHVTEFETSPGECHFSVKSVDGNYRISDIDYLSE